MLEFNVHTDGLDALTDKLKHRANATEKRIAKEVKEDTSPFVPYKTGRLDSKTTVKGNKIIYPGPYARFLYYGKLMVDPDTGSPWARAGVKKVVTDKNLVFTKTVHGQAQSHWFEASLAVNLKKWLKSAGRGMSGGK
jgi:hypothetical protein